MPKGFRKEQIYTEVTTILDYWSIQEGKYTKEVKVHQMFIHIQYGFKKVYSFGEFFFHFSKETNVKNIAVMVAILNLW